MGWRTALAGRLFTSGSAGKPRINLALLLILLGVTALFTPWSLMSLKGAGGNEDTLLDSRTPVRAVRFIREHRLQGHIFHPQIYGDYMIWTLYPSQKVFVDGRVHLYGREIWEDYLLMIRGADWERLTRHYSIQHAMVDRADSGQRRLEELLEGSSDWQRVYRDGRSAIYSRVATPAQTSQVP
jgi:hypothetical protein